MKKAESERQGQQYDLPLEEVKRAYEEQLKSVDSIKQTIRTIFGASSLIVSLTSGLQIMSSIIVPERQGVFIAGIVAAAILYILLIFFCIAGMWPTSLAGPIKMDWDVLSTVFVNMTEEDRKAKYISGLLNAMKINQPVITRLVMLERAALIALPVLVTLLLILAFLPRL